MAETKREVEYQGTRRLLPSNVVEQSPDRTTVYTAGKLVYDGATGGTGNAMATRTAASSWGPGGAPGASLNEMLQWGIANSSASDLEHRAAAGARPLQKIDKEIMDMLLGQPAVASMRSALGKLEPSELDKEEGIDAALAALEELEYYCESVDNAVDCAKIGGIETLLQCMGGPAQPQAEEAAVLQPSPPQTEHTAVLQSAPQQTGDTALLQAAPPLQLIPAQTENTAGLQSAASQTEGTARLQCIGSSSAPQTEAPQTESTDESNTAAGDTGSGVDSRLPTLSSYHPEVAAAACGVLAAAAQNNPPVQRACLALRAHRVLLALLLPKAPPDAPPTCPPANPPASITVRQKACLALSALIRASADAAAAVLALPQAPGCLAALAADPDTKIRRRTLFLLLCLLRDFSLSPDALRPMLPPSVLLASAGDEDSDVREAALQLTLALSGDGQFRREVRAGGGEEQFSTALGEASAGLEQAVLTELLPRIAEE